MKNTVDITAYLDEILDIHGVQDRSQNGLQVANSGKANKIGLAVDASLATFQAAAAQHVDFLLVHHGLFWGQPENIVGPLYQRIKFLMDHDMALYAAHLPLDLHDTLGNNAQIVHKMKWLDEGPFGLYHGTAIGRAARLNTAIHRDLLCENIGAYFEADPLLWPFGPETVERIAIVSGGGLGQMKEAAEAGFDLLLTGEPAHASYWPASELKMNVLFAGHYATETWGVKAAGQALSKKFDLETEFIDLPTGH